VEFAFSEHAKNEIERRSIPRSVVDSVLEQPQQIVSEREGKSAYQSRVEFGGHMFLVRVIVAHDLDPPVVVTVYRTTRIGRYWKAE
jgi:hypothetical protein